MLRSLSNRPGRFALTGAAAFSLILALASSPVLASTVRPTSTVRPNGPQGSDVAPRAQVQAATLSVLTSAQIVARAWNWYIADDNPPYSQQAYWHSPTDYAGDSSGDAPNPYANPPSWREDCSGFVSYAWGFSDLDGGFTTYDVDRYAIDIPWIDLLPGDALLLNGVDIGGIIYNHMGLFMGWNADGTYNVMDETQPGTGTNYQTEIPTNDGFWQYAQPIRYVRTVPPAPPISGVATSFAADSHDLGMVAVETPTNGLDVYWEEKNGVWNGPTHLGPSGTVFSAPSLVINSRDLATVAVRGPNNSLSAYWEGSDGVWRGPAPIAPGGQAFSTPSLASTAHDLGFIAVEGTNHTLSLYSEGSNGVWHGARIGSANTAFSAPAVVTNTHDLAVIAVGGPSQSLLAFWEDSNGAWHGPVPVGRSSTTFSAPALTNNSHNLSVMAVQGPNQSLLAFWEDSKGAWNGPVPIGPYRTTFSAPALTNNSHDLGVMAVQGPNQSLLAFWEDSNGAWHGVGLGSAGTTFSSPSLVDSSVDLAAVAAQGPYNELVRYWEASNGAWFGPAHIGGNGTTG